MINKSDNTYVPWSRRPASEYSNGLLNVAGHLLQGLLASGKHSKAKDGEAAVKESVTLAADLLDAVDEQMKA